MRPSGNDEQKSLRRIMEAHGSNQTRPNKHVNLDGRGCRNSLASRSPDGEWVEWESGRDGALRRNKQRDVEMRARASREPAQHSSQYAFRAEGAMDDSLRL